MNTAHKFLGLLREKRFDFFTGVPCSLLKGVMNTFEEDDSFGYISATREDSALGIASGAYLAGKKPAVFMQNSGMGVSINALGSLMHLYRIPTLLVVSWRGEGGFDAEKPDAPEHLLVGQVMEDFFRLFEIPHVILDGDKMEEQIAQLDDTMNRTSRPVALLVRKGLL